MSRIWSVFEVYSIFEQEFCVEIRIYSHPSPFDVNLIHSLISRIEIYRLLTQRKIVLVEAIIEGLGFGNHGGFVVFIGEEILDFRAEFFIFDRLGDYHFLLQSHHVV